jgi:hypothetical protein
MSLVARIALGVAVLAVLAVGAVIFYVLPQLGAPADNMASTVAATPAASPPPGPANTAAPSDATPAPANPPSAQTPPGDNAAPASPGSEVSPPLQPPEAPAPAPADTAPAQPAPGPAPEPLQPSPVEPSPVPSAGAPIPLAPAPNAAPAAAASAPLNPAEPGAGNIAVFLNQTMTMGGTADARSLPLAEAPVLTRLEKGSAVKVVGVLAGDLWLQVELADQRIGYVPAAAIPDAVSPNAAPAPAAAAPGPAPAQPSFMAVSEQLTTTATTPVYGAPNTAGAPKQTLQAGTQVQIIAKSNDGQWAWLQTPDGQEAYVQMATLSVAPPAPAPAPVLPDTVTGHAKVVNTATLIVDGRRIQLFGIRGEGGVYAAQLRSLIESQGGVLSCHRRDTLYTCSLPGNLDIARAALFNGAALPAANAPADYQDQAAAARQARRGLWGR